MKKKLATSLTSGQLDPQGDRELVQQNGSIPNPRRACTKEGRRHYIQQPLLLVLKDFPPMSAQRFRQEGTIHEDELALACSCPTQMQPPSRPGITSSGLSLSDANAVAPSRESVGSCAAKAR
jgi:hypothetical protein